MKLKNIILFRLLIGLIVIVLLSVNLLTAAQAAPPAQDPRPPADTGGGGGGGGGSGGGGGGSGSGGNGGGSGVTGNVPINPGSTEPGCAATTGQVINWGLGPQSDVVVELKTGSWRTATTSSSEGNYGLGGLGVGMATLQVVLAPGETLQPLIQDAGVYLNCGYPTVANIALFSGSRIDPPASIEMSAPSQTIAPDSNFEVTLTVKNSLPSEVTNVIVTDLMPRGFTALKVDSSVDFKDAQIINGGEDGQLVVVNLDKLAAGAEAEIQLTINADVDLLNGTKIRNAATLFYRESAADQASLDFTVGSDELPVLTASAGAGQGADFVPPGEAPTTGGSSTGSGAQDTGGSEESASTTREPAAASDNSVPPGNMPSTGGEIDLPLDKLDPTGLINFAEARLVVGRQADEVNDSSAQTSKLAMVADGSQQDKVSIVHNAVSRESSITVAASLLFLGLLVLGSGITLWRHRSDSL